MWAVYLPVVQGRVYLGMMWICWYARRWSQETKLFQSSSRGLRHGFRVIAVRVCVALSPLLHAGPVGLVCSLFEVGVLKLQTLGGRRAGLRTTDVWIRVFLLSMVVWVFCSQYSQLPLCLRMCGLEHVMRVILHEACTRHSAPLSACSLSKIQLHPQPFLLS